LILSTTQSLLGLASGALVGFSLGLVGGGGSILAVPLMVYVVGVGEPHVAIGTSAIAVAANAAVNLSNHARGGTVVWSCALMFAAAGVAGAFGGSILGKMLDGQSLLALFALVMLVIAMLMLKTRARLGLPDVKMSLTNLPAIVGLGLVTGTMSGFFGIGGGFLIVPALMPVVLPPCGVPHETLPAAALVPPPFVALPLVPPRLAPAEPVPGTVAPGATGPPGTVPLVPGLAALGLSGPHEPWNPRAV